MIYRLLGLLAPLSRRLSRFRRNLISGNLFVMIFLAASIVAKGLTCGDREHDDAGHFDLRAEGGRMIARHADRVEQFDTLGILRRSPLSSSRNIQRVN
jgi:hypothetical protein